MKDGKLTARQLVDMYLSRIDAYDKKGPALNAVILVNPKAREIADELDAKFRATGPVGPLHGVPVLLKDNTNTADMPTTGGSLSLEGYVPPEDATIVKKLKAAGAIIIAKPTCTSSLYGAKRSVRSAGRRAIPMISPEHQGVRVAAPARG